MEHIYYIRIGEQIKNKRKQVNLTQEKLAEYVGVSATHICNIENAKTKLSLDLLCTICETLCCSIDSIVYGDYVSVDNNKYFELLNQCSTQESNMIYDVVYALVELFKKNKNIL